ncbi:MAG: putative packaged DNA stabilization protein [Prokaryotic dsDNA virus sp.]|nr:MAG: putative packaged DNA stabilization protein [Prokaryotic dsDNA virus sp.]|tara:strand:+ start:20496 stop:21905 length:1410 start_codon:yes stop_codon:yes gene_type:complete
MAKIKLPLITGDRHSDLDYRTNLPVNMTAVIKRIKDSDGYLLSHDGLTSFSDTNGKARGGTFNERFDKHYRVSGDNFESIDIDGTVTSLGLTPGDGVCSLAESFNTQAILTDGKLYLWDNASLIQVTDPDLGFPIDITWFRGIYVMTDGQFLFHTDINNEFSINPLKYSSSEFSSDRIIAVARNDENQILAFNRYSTEYFYFNANAPSGTSVLQVISGKAIKVGIVGTHCKAELDGVFFILGGRKKESPSIHIMSGGSVTPVATREVDKIISKYTEKELSTAVLESRTVDRDMFLIVHLPHETLLYNHSVGKKLGIDSAWSYVKTGVDTDDPWRGKFGVFDPRVAKWIYGDVLENKLGYLNDEIASQYDEQVECICYTPILSLETFSIDEFDLDTIPGYSASDFTSAFSMSYDGITYGEEQWNLISVMGGYNKRYVVRNLGYIRDSFNFKFRFVSDEKMAFSGLKVTYS